MSERTTEQLAQAAAGGDRLALDELLVRHLPDLRAYVRLRMGAGLRSVERESDLLQSVCREILQGAERFRFGGDGAFKSWLYTTTVRKLSKRAVFHRAERRDAGRTEDVEDEQLLDSYRRFASPSQAAVASDQLERIEAAFAGLPEEYREVILLSRVVGLSRSQVAREMNRSESSVRNLLHRALARLTLAVDEPDGSKADQ